MKNTVFAALAIILSVSLSAATRQEESRLRLHLAGTFSGQAWIADLVVRSDAATVTARMANGMEIQLEGRLMDTQIVFTSTNKAILPGSITADIPDGTTAIFRPVWTWRSQKQEFPARVVARERVVSDLRENRHEASCAWPVVGGYNTYANTTITAILSNFAVSNHAAFLKSSADPEERDGNTGLWAHHLGYDLYAATERFVSVRFALYTYTGGAHPGRWTHSFNFAISGESARVLRLGSLLRTGMLEPLLRLVQDKLREKGASWPNEVNGGHLENFCITPTGLDFHFDPYIAGSYAEGDYSVFLAWNELEQFVSAGVR